MTKEEAMQLIEKKEFTIKELFEFYGVRNIEGLESYLETRFDKVDTNNEYLVNAFKFIFETRELENFNPLEEKYRYYAMILPGLYGIAPDNMQILVAGLGLFKTIMMVEKLLKDKEEVIYFNQLYQIYINEMYSIGRTANKYVKLLDNTLKDFLQKNNKESLSQVVKEFINSKDIFLNKVE
jgi:hypothetical protein